MPATGASLDSAAAPQRGDPAGDGCCVGVWRRRPAPDARVRVRWPPSPYSKGASKRTGLTVWPVAGAVFEGFLLVVYADRHLRDRAGGLVALLVSMCILLAFQTGAVTAARRNTKTHPADTAGAPLHSLKPGLIKRTSSPSRSIKLSVTQARPRPFKLCSRRRTSFPCCMDGLRRSLCWRADRFWCFSYETACRAVDTAPSFRAVPTSPGRFRPGAALVLIGPASFEAPVLGLSCPWAPQQPSQ
jgi:hypothetical protein